MINASPRFRAPAPYARAPRCTDATPLALIGPAVLGEKVTRWLQILLNSGPVQSKQVLYILIQTTCGLWDATNLARVSRMSDQCLNQLDRSSLKNLPAAEELMDLTLQMKWGSLLGEKIRVPVGQSVKVGRSSQCDIPIAYDHYMSRTHFSLGWEGSTCWIYDLNSHHGTFLNGKKVQKAPLGDGDAIRAGLTMLVVRQHRDDSDEPVGICEAGRPVITF